MLDMKSEFKKTMLGLAYIIVLITIIRFLKLTFWQIYFTLLGISIIRELYKNKKINIKVTAKTAAYLLTIMGILKALQPLGIPGYFLGIIIICIAILYKNRNKWLQVVEHIETMIWGKPLTQFKKKGAKPPKIKLKKS